jgi:hypothetical protein
VIQHLFVSVAGFVFQASASNHSAISPFKINHLRTRQSKLCNAGHANRVAKRVIGPSQGSDLDIATAAPTFGATRFEALYRAWQQRGDDALHRGRHPPHEPGGCR